MTAQEEHKGALQLEVLTPEATCLKVEDVTAVRAMLSEGPICVLPGHAPLVGILVAGELGYADHRGDHRVGIDEGILRIHGSTVTVLGTDVRVMPLPAQADR